jgi:hypothetical protein
MFDVADGNVNQFEFCCKKIGLNFFTKVRTSCVDRVCIKEKIIHLRECYL